MSAAVRLVSRRGRRSSLLPPLPLLSIASHALNPNSRPCISSVSHQCIFSPCLSTSSIFSRNFSWTPWFHGSSRRDDDRALDFSEKDSQDLFGFAVGRDDTGVEGSWLSNAVYYVTSLLDGYHDLTGFPWWIVIGTSTLALRASLLPVLLLQLKKTAQIAALFPKLPPPLPPPLSGKSFREQFYLFRSKRKELCCPSFMWSFAYFFVQFPCFLLWMYSIRRMCLECHSGFEHGGILWFQNLTVNPNGVLGPFFPVMIAALHFANVQVSFRTVQFEKMSGLFGLLVRYYKLYLDILFFPLVIITFFIPQGSLIYWFTNSSLALIQQLSLSNSHVRKKLGLPEVKLPEKRRFYPLEGVSDENRGAIEIEISTDSLSAEKLLDISLEEMAQGNQDRAFPLLQVAVEKDPESARAFVALGQILCSRNLLDEAVEHFEKAIPKITDNNPGLLSLAYFGAGFSHIRKGRTLQGVEHLKKIALLEEPENPLEKVCYYQGLVMLASTLFKEGNKSEAAKYLKRAATYDPGVYTYLKECEDSLPK